MHQVLVGCQTLWSMDASRVYDGMVFVNMKKRWVKQPTAWIFALSALLYGCKLDEQPLEITPSHTDQDASERVSVGIKQLPSATPLNRRTKAQDECPRLVQKRIDNTVISRKDSILSSTCDYFIYPAIGDVVSVAVSDRRLKPYLNTPYYHDFANGDYQVVANGRHVIRLEYDAFERQPAVMDYVITVEVKPSEY
ncbi:hypothetical protein LU276_05215 [Moraxella haemolytica]|uniref:hypothetical protein n=1 Tax=Moraxella haemolytica TaxID=2904119 RepID=UPI002542C283|nr:hypothetical protein [Moraxella sp. ZY171148]WII94444.1 hypothetical protein LU276_05215 [Moraxella sp. ZY171148]